MLTEYDITQEYIKRMEKRQEQVKTQYSDFETWVGEFDRLQEEHDALERAELEH